jgi:hypothetical protein
MLSDYRHWLDTELKRLGHGNHHAFSAGQASMAKHAMERLDQELEGRVAVLLPRTQADAILTALEELLERETALDPALDALRGHLHTAFAQGR